jgi:sporulation protein YpjB
LFLFRLSHQGRRRNRRMMAGVILVTLLIITSPATAWGDSASISRKAASVGSVAAGGESSSDLINAFLEASEALYEAVNEGRIDAALSRVKETERLFRSLPMNNIATAEGIQALARNITELKRAAAAASPDKQIWEWSAATLRLAADALAHPDQPIWHQYRAILQEDIVRLSEELEQKSAASGAVSKAAHNAYDQLTEHYRLIRTSVLLQLEAWKVERGDSAVRYVSRVLSAAPPNPALLQGVIPLLEATMEGLFPPSKTTESTFAPPIAGPPWGWSAMMGSFIVTILTWVGWRRYRADPYTTIGKALKPSETQDAAERLFKSWYK